MHRLTATLPLAFLLAACTTRNPPISQRSARTPPVPQNIAITLERTACYGTCPVYKVTIDEHGTIIYNGVSFVATKGIQTTTIDPAKVESLLAQARALGFWSMNDTYTAEITDLPTTITTITIGTKTKRVVDYADGPRSLRKLENLIDQTANTAHWISDKQADRD